MWAPGECGERSASSCLASRAPWLSSALGRTRTSPGVSVSVKLLRILRTAWLAAVVAGCHDQTTQIIDDSCFMDPAPITVRSRVLAVGDTATFSARIGEPRKCLPDGLEPVVWRWTGRDTVIARIDSVSGIATALQPGTTWIMVRHLRAPEVTSSVQLTVLGSPGR